MLGGSRKPRAARGPTRSAASAATLGHSLKTARLRREHNDAQILAIGARVTSEHDAKEVIDLARACAAISRFDQLLLTVHSWKATAEEVAAGYTPDNELEWLEAVEVVADPRG